MTRVRRRKSELETFRVCGGKFFVERQPVAVHDRVLKIGLLAAGLDAATLCGEVGPAVGRRILHMERSLLMADLEAQLKRVGVPDRVA